MHAVERGVEPPRHFEYCGARAVQGPDRRNVYFIVFILVVPTILYFIFTTPFIWTTVTPALPILSALLFLFSFGALMAVSFTDPGILPRVPHNDSKSDELAPLKITVKVNNVDVDSKYCETCNIYRPPRASHCSTCNNCIERFDHHCPYLSTCIGRRNYRFFLSFIFSVFVYALFIAAQAGAHIGLLAQTGITIAEAMALAPISAVLFLLGIVGSLSLLVLVQYHCSLLTKQLTTNEQLTYRYPGKNPYKKASCWSELRFLCCGPLSISWVRLWQQERDKKPVAGESV